MKGVLSCAKCTAELGVYIVNSQAYEVEIRLTCQKCWTVTAVRKVTDPHEITSST